MIDITLYIKIRALPTSTLRFFQLFSCLHEELIRATMEKASIFKATEAITQHQNMRGKIHIDMLLYHDDA